MLGQGFPDNWSTLKRLVWSRLLLAAKYTYSTFTGSIARFLSPSSNPVKSIVCNIEPVQDLHGYDNPWPAGGGKNQFNIDDPLGWGGGPSGGEISVSGVTISLKIVGFGLTRYYHLQHLVGNQTVTFSGTSSKPQARTFIRLRKMDDSGWMTSSDASISGFTYNSVYDGWYSDLGDNLQFSKKAVIPECLYWNAGVGYNNVSVTTGDTETISYFQIEAGSTATSFAPYSNICPISGFTGLNVYGTGKNMIDDGYSSSYTNVVFLPVGTYYLQAFVTESPSQHTTKPQVYVNGSWVNVTPPYSADDGAISITGSDFGWLWNNAMQTITITKGGYFIRCNRNDNAMQTRRLSLSTEQQTDFAEYVGTTLPVSWQSEAGTVYAGYLSIDKDGNTKVTGTYAGVDMSTLTYQLHSNTSFRQGWQIVGYGSIAAPASSTNDNIHAISSEFKSTSYNATWTPYIIAPQNSNGTGAVVTFPPNSYSTGEEVATALDGVQLVYELKEPVTYTLSSVTVPSTVQGENNWWHDANGNITVEAIGTPISSDEPDALQSLNILLGGAYTPRANFSEPTDEQALNIIMGGSR